MATFKVSILINSKPDVVTQALMKPDNFPYWETDLKKFMVVKGKPGEVGSVALLFFSQKGKTYMMEDELIYAEPGKKYISKITGDALTAHVETRLEEKGGQTMMTLKWSGRGRILMLKLLLPVMRGKIKRHAKKELKTFKHLVETKGSDFSK